MVFSVETEMVVRLILASLLGAVIGLEREVHGRPAGFRLGGWSPRARYFSLRARLGKPARAGAAPDACPASREEPP